MIIKNDIDQKIINSKRKHGLVRLSNTQTNKEMFSLIRTSEMGFTKDHAQCIEEANG